MKRLTLALALALSCGGRAPAERVVIVGAPAPPASTGAPKPAPPAPTPSYKPEIPPAEPLDGNLDSAGWTFLAATDTHLWMSSLFPSDPQPHYSVVVDLAKGCAVESYPEDPELFARFEQNPESESAAIRKLVGLGARFGVTEIRFTPLAWSKEGPYVVVGGGSLYVSRDGGRHFEVGSAGPARDLHVTPDGKTVVYEHDDTLIAYGLDGAQKPRVLATLRGSSTEFVFAEGISNDGHALVWRTDATQGCIERIAPSTGAVDSRVCTKDSHFSKNGQRDLVKFSGFSPKETYYALDWEGRNPRYLTYETAIVDAKTGNVVRTLPEWQLHGLDDRGTALVAPWAEGGGDSISMFELGKPKKLLFKETMMTWDPVTRRAILDVSPFRQVRKLGKAACKLVKVTKTP